MINGTQPRVVLGGDEIVLHDFHDDDPVVVAAVRDHDCAEEAVHSCLQVGARALRSTQVQLETNQVDLAFERLTARFESQVQEAAQQLQRALAAGVGDENSELAMNMTRFRQELELRLGATFDAQTKGSVVDQIAQVLSAERQEQAQALRRVLDPSSPDSPMSAYRHDILRAVRDEADQLRHAFCEFAQGFAVRDAQAQLQERCPSKGASYEVLVHEALSAITAAQGDLAGQTATETGSDGRKTGDEVVTLAPEVSHGRDLRYVIEVKDRSMSMAAIQGELDRALTNRQAGAAIAVFSCQAHCPGPQPFQAFGNKALVVFDKEHPDAGALRLATVWARWMLCRDLVVAQDGVDVSAAQSAIGDATRSLDRIATIRRCHGAVAKKISEAGDQVSGLQSDLEQALGRLGEVLTCA